MFSSATCTALRLRNSPRSTRSTRDIFQRIRPPESLSASLPGRAASTSKLTASLQFSASVQTTAARRERFACRSICILDVGVWTIAAGGRLGMPAAFLVLVFDDLRVPGHALLGGGNAGCCQRRLVRRKRLREHAVDLVRPAVVVADDLICDMRHGCTCWWQLSTWSG